MAPLPPGLKKPSARSFRHARLSGAVHPLAPLKTFRPDATPSLSDAFLSSKRDKRLMKHSSFVSRVASSAGIAKKTRKPRRSSNKLATTLDGLADALPELEEGPAQPGKVRHRSIRSNKGALRRKEKVVKGEMHRFGVSMAQMAATQQQGGKSEMGEEGEGKTGVPPQPPSRWAALRGYISATMEQNPAFVGRS
ncbi:hypothetical protein A9K55_005439 [Cordyceps militaris]|uniref:Ribosome biogenesis protein SLX9 n=1 Tax=Cordyceps militaris TaxID=73501 RepID=A0A2H4SCH7_CORMI|nr:hypothetical protein A9K55_005439 [Cordyceps militaris]